MRYRNLAAAAAAAGLAVTVLLAPAPAAAIPGVNCAEPGEAEVPASWPRALLRAGELGTVADGTGARVAILSTGVDAGQPQLRNRVLGGVDTVDGGAADADCTGTGTQVAGVVAGRTDEGDADVAGLAPGARILPVRVQLDDPAGSEPDPDAMAAGIGQAVADGADVIVVATPVYRDDPDLEQAVAAAIDEGVVVVAAAGDLGAADEGNPTPYPAAYRDVLGVGAIDRTGRIWPDSQRGDFVDLVAPGVAVPVLQTGRGAVEVTGTAVAAGFAGAAAALLHDRRPDLGVRESVRLLTGTAVPAPAGPAFGAGVVDPYAAITGQLAAPERRPVPGVEVAPLPDTAAESRRRAVALAGVGVAGMLVITVGLVTAAIRRSRRQQWRPGLAPALPVREEPLEPGPPVMLLEDRTG
ncbi:S8 family serine peptidase [Actinoplanes sp. DH11]|uniref:S8 family serine peptidase n=1 Tax=Actinoplanes sp. DH11 TaxID=2857011 RepID=UPI001E3DF845|nr:S8 family serine peptidase [Actinoplanes sp. DH11]